MAYLNAGIAGFPILRLAVRNLVKLRPRNAVSRLLLSLKEDCDHTEESDTGCRVMGTGRTRKALVGSLRAHHARRPSAMVAALARAQESHSTPTECSGVTKSSFEMIATFQTGLCSELLFSCKFDRVYFGSAFPTTLISFFSSLFIHLYCSPPVSCSFSPYLFSETSSESHHTRLFQPSSLFTLLYLPSYPSLIPFYRSAAHQPTNHALFRSRNSPRYRLHLFRTRRPRSTRHP